MIRALLIALLAASPAAAQQGGGLSPTIEVSIDPTDPVAVGTPVEIAVTVLVPSYMPQPPVWPNLEIADAITQLPDRATVPTMRRVGQKTWSGLIRRYEITPQREADFDLGKAEVTVTYADPDTNDTRVVMLSLPDVRISAVLPEGAEGMNPFIAAQSLTLNAKIDGLPKTPKPGDAFKLVLKTTATGTRSMLLPIADRLPVPAGLRAYPQQPELTDTPGGGGNPATATRSEAIAFVIETPGNYILPGQSITWWNTGTKSVESATTDPIGIDVAGAPGEAALHVMRSTNPLLLAGAALLLTALVYWLGVLRHRRRMGMPASTERRLYWQLRRAVRRDRVETIRPRLARWLSALTPADAEPRIETCLRQLERAAFGPDPMKADVTTRAELIAAIRDRRRIVHRRRQGAQAVLPGLNPDWQGPLKRGRADTRPKI